MLCGKNYVAHGTVKTSGVHKNSPANAAWQSRELLHAGKIFFRAKINEHCHRNSALAGDKSLAVLRVRIRVKKNLIDVLCRDNHAVVFAIRKNKVASATKNKVVDLCSAHGRNHIAQFLRILRTYEQFCCAAHPECGFWRERLILRERNVCQP